MDLVAVSRTLSSLALLSAALGLGLLLLLAVRGGRARLARELAGEERALLGMAWIVAVVSTAGSLYFSQSAGFAPCVLCWYQRIAMYPLVLVLGVGVLTGDGGAWRYALPLPVAGLFVAGYHIVLQHRPALDVGTCSADVPCTLRYVSVFGFVSIPVMAAGGFLLVTGLLLAVRNAAKPPLP